jgi:hypothetical protein
MKNNLLRSVLILAYTFTAIGMDTAQNPDLPSDAEVGIIAACDGKTKNILAQTCKRLHTLLGKEKEMVLQHRLINLEPIEKHLLLLEYVEQGNAGMVNHMFALGATQKVLRIFGYWQNPLLHCGSIESVYVPHLASFPKVRTPYACINQQRTLLHVAVVKKQHAIAQILLDQMQNNIGHTPTLINAQDIQGDTPMHLAVRNNDLAMATILLRYPGLNLNIANMHKNDPLNTARLYRFKAIVDLLFPAVFNRLLHESQQNNGPRQ